MTDYKALGMKAGLEIHQQLDTKKLFCRCPSIVHDQNPDIQFSRKLKAVIGETGVIDEAAKHEMKKNLTYNYIACSTSSCLVEADEEPPQPINKDAVFAALIVAKMLNAKMVDEIQVMRKTVIDGSNVSGFQRTALVAMDGYIETTQGKVRIPTICLEEEAAQKVEEDEKSKTYRLDRLGIPLIELATETDILSPEHAKEAAEKLGMMLRSTNKVKRGIGTIRQDVNVSIKGGARTEIKGFQDLKSIPEVMEKEIARQHKLVKTGKTLQNEVRKAEPNGETTFLRPMPGAARMYPETDIVPLVISKELLDTIKLPELIEEKIARFTKDYNINKDLAKLIIKSNKADLFETAAKQFKIKPAFIADVIITKPTELKRNKVPIEKITDNNYEELLRHLDNGEIPKEAVNQALEAFAKKSFNINNFKGIDDKELEAEIKNIIKENKGAPIGALMGKAMAKFRGKADGKKVMELLKKFSTN